MQATLTDVQELSVVLESGVVRGEVDQKKYQALRQLIVDDPVTGPIAPAWLRKYRDLGQLRRFMQSDITSTGQQSTYRERRDVIGRGLEPLLDALERGVAPLDHSVNEAVRAFTSEEVGRVWGIALQRRSTDPDGAITIARTLVESVLKHIVAELDSSYTPEKLADMKLPQLYTLVSERLQLSPAQHDREDFKKILDGCSAVVSGLGSFRHEYGDVHGKGPRPRRAAPRHAELAVNLAGAMASFLVQTWAARVAEWQRVP